MASLKRGLVFLLHKNPQFLEIIKNYENYHEKPHVTPMTMIRLALIENWIEPYSSVLEVGCGEGFNMQYLVNVRNVNAIGIDVSIKAVEKARARGLRAFVRDAESENLSSIGKFDYVLLIEVLEHLRYPHKVLLEACKVASKGVIVTLPNSGWIGWRMQLLRGYFPRQSFTHLHFFTIRDFDLFLKTLGLRALDMKTELDYYQVNVFPCNKFKNLLAYQQAWLIMPCNNTNKS